MLVIYAYFGYPVVLLVWGRISGFAPTEKQQDFKPGLTVLIPVHNEGQVISDKLTNTLALEYPRSALEILIISDGSTDDTNDIIRECENNIIKLVEVSEQKGKANALNVGLELARHEIIVFSDASIMLEPQALLEISAPFLDDAIGCVSGEDHILEGGGEGAYGRYELWLRNQESRFYSVVGASGSFYAQRKSACKPFEEGMAPDFLSVMYAAEMGYRAVTEPRAIGYMSSVNSSTDEFNRKIRTLIRGMSALFYKFRLMNIFRYGRLSISLISHKLIRWLVPCFLLIILGSSFLLVNNDFYRIMFLAQLGFYLIALLAYRNIAGLQRSGVVKIILYFSLVNLGILIAWIRFLKGTRQEIWSPSVRS